MLRLNEGGLVLREYFGEIGIHADRLCDCAGGLFVVTGHHDQLGHAEFPQSADDISRFRAQRILNADDCRQHTGDSQVQVRIRIWQGVKLGLLPCRDDAVLILKDKVMAADDDLLPVDTAGNAVRDQILHTRMALLMAQTAARCLRDDRFGHGVRIVLLQTGSQTQHIRLVIAAEGHNLCDFRLGARQRTGLVKDDRASLGHSLKEPPALDGQVMIAGLSHGGEYGDRHRELECAGEIDHQHRQRFGHIPRQKPDQGCCAQTVRNELVRKVRRVVLRCGLELFRLLDHADDAVVAAAAGALFHADGAVALFDDGTGIDITAFRSADG